MEFIRHIVAVVRGRFAHRSVDKTIGQFAKAADKLNTHAGHLTVELASNQLRQAEIEARNEALRTQRQRANNVKRKLQEFVA